MRKIAVLSVSLILIFISISFYNTQTSSNEEYSTSTKYIETKQTLPNEIIEIFAYASTAEDTLTILCSTVDDKIAGYLSDDLGVSWNKIETINDSFLPSDYEVSYGYIHSTNGFYIVCGEVDYNDPVIAKPSGNLKYYKLNIDGDAEELNLTLPSGNEHELRSGYGLSQIQVSDNGSIYGILQSYVNEEYSSYQLYRYGGTNFEEVSKFNLNQYANYTLVDNEVMVFTDNELICLSEDLSEIIDTFNMPESYSNTDLISYDATHDLLYYLNNEIYSYSKNSVVTEQLTNASLSEINLESVKNSGFLVVDEELFLVFIQDTKTLEYSLISYNYTTTSSAKEKEQLAIYSLRENPVISQLITEFSIENPEIDITYEIGMDADSALTTEEAINLLNTEILAGNGADIIVTNGLPTESFQGNGVFEDIDYVIEPYINNDQLYNNLFEAFQYDGHQYLVPICFKVPFIVGNSNVISSVDDLETLTELAAESSSESIIYRNDAELLRYVLAVYSNYWYDKESGINNTVLEKLLRQINDLNNVIKEHAAFEYQPAYEAFGEDDPNFLLTYDEFFMDTGFSYTFSLLNNDLFMDMGYLSSFLNFALLYNMDITSDLAYTQMNSDSNTFYALSIGMLSKSENKDTASDFISFVLNSDTQQMFFDDMGLPVNRIAFELLTEKPIDSILESFNNDFTNFEWPNKEVFNELDSIIQNLDTPIIDNRIIWELVTENGTAYLSGEKSITDTLSTITKAVNLYTAEQN